MFKEAALVVLICCQEAYGHGFMYYPWSWNDNNQIPPYQGLTGATFGFDFIQPDVVCDSNSGAQCASASKKGHSTTWFTNFTFIPGSGPSMPDEMYDDYPLNPVEVDGVKRWNPWSQPGSAPVFGQGCGANGGNPDGCHGCGVDGIFYGGCKADNVETNPWGTCCGGSRRSNGKWKPGCGGYVGGKSALEHYDEGHFLNTPTTTWKIGNVYPVYWKTGAGHRGGYAYRLCKVPAGGITQVTEQCFQDGHLDFVGDFNYVYNGMNRQDAYDENKWIKTKAVRTNQGTTPPGSQWTKLTVEVDKKNKWSFKDHVKVPDNLTPGDYILSFRWDSHKTPQIWNNCANIKLVN